MVLLLLGTTSLREGCSRRQQMMTKKAQAAIIVVEEIQPGTQKGEDYRKGLMGRGMSQWRGARAKQRLRAPKSSPLLPQCNHTARRDGTQGQEQNEGGE